MVKKKTVWNFFLKKTVFTSPIPPLKYINIHTYIFYWVVQAF